MERRDDRRDVPDRRDWADRKDEVVRRDDRLLPTREERYCRFPVLILREHFTSIKHRDGTAGFLFSYYGNISQALSIETVLQVSCSPTTGTFDKHKA